MSETLQDALQRLAQCTWRRDFRRDSQLLESAFEEKVPEFVQALQAGAAEIRKDLHPSHTLDLDIETTFALYIHEQGRPEPLAVCYVDTSTAGKIVFTLKGDRLKEETYSVRLERYAPDQIIWMDGSGQGFIASFLAAASLKKLVEAASAAVETDRVLYEHAQTPEEPVVEEGDPNAKG